MLLAAQLMQGVAAVIGGLVLDKVKIWPILLSVAMLLVLLLSCFYLTSNNLVGANLTAGERGSLLQNISFTLILFLNSANFQLVFTYLGKLL